MGTAIIRRVYENRIIMTGAYTGPGDIVSGATAWWGFRAYNAAKAAALTNAVRLVRASDSAQQDFTVLANGTLDVASITTFLAATSGKIVTLYDQTGNGNHFTQATDGSRPAYTANAVSSLPGMTFVDTRFLGDLTFSIAQPFTVSTVLKCTAVAFITSCFIGDNSSRYMNFNEGTGQDDISFKFDGSLASVTATLNAWHAFQGVINGASSNGYVDGAANTVNPGSSGFGSTIRLGDDNSGHPFIGSMTEIGIWPSAFTTGASQQAANMDTNQSAYWGV
jgi:hypothetical protein